MANQKMSERITTIVITVLITGVLSVVGSALTNGALIGALKGATQDDIKALRKEIDDLPRGSATVSVGDVAANLARNHSEKLRGEAGATAEQVVAELKSNHWKELRGEPGPAESADLPKGIVAAFDLRDGCPKGWKAFRDAAGRVIIGVGSGTRDENGDRLTRRNHRDDGGEEMHRLTSDELPDQKITFDKPMYRFHGSANSLSQPGRNYLIAACPYPPGGYGDCHDTTTRKGELITAEAQGKGKAHNNMPPYLALHFCKYEGSREHASR